MNQKYRQGFSLAEALITMVIISMVMAATMPIVIRAQNSPSEAPWKYVTQGDLVQNSAVYTVLGETAVSVFGDKKVPIDSNISSDKDSIFATKINPKISIVTRNRTAGPVLARHLLDFYEKETTGNYTNIGKISFDQFFNLAVGQNALDYIKHDSSNPQKIKFDSGTAINWNEISRLSSSGNPIDTTNTVGAANTAVGQYAMAGNLRYTNLNTAANAEPNIVGIGNTALGAFAMRRISSGSLNTGIGLYSLQNIQSSYYNTAVGAYTLKNSSGAENVAMGTFALEKNTTGTNNTAIGTYALQENTTGQENTILGVLAAQGNTTGGYNVAVGKEALRENTTGGQNIAIGYKANTKNSDGTYNIAIGYNAMPNNRSGKYNIAIGSNVFQTNATGSGNIIIGHNVGIAESNNKLYIGGYVTTAGATSLNGMDAMLYGDLKDQQLLINTKSLVLGKETGTDSIVTLRARDVIIGENGQQTNRFLSIFGTINALSPIMTFNSSNSFNVSATNQINLTSPNTRITGTLSATGNISTSGTISDSTGQMASISWVEGYVNARVSDARLKNILGDNRAGLKEIMQIQVKNYTMKRDKKKEVLVGVIAQELQKVFPNSVIEGRDGYLRIKRDEIFYACVNAIKELNNMVQEVIAKITGLEEKIRILEDTNKLNQEKIAALEKQNKLFEERLSALENIAAKKAKETKEIKETKKAKDAAKTEKTEQQEVASEETTKEENK